MIHDRDTIYSEGVDRTLAAMGLTVLKTPVRAPTANAFCERLVGTMRRECLDFVIPLNERQCAASFVSGSLITIEEGFTPPLDRVSRIDHRSRLPSRRTAIVFRWTTGFCQPRSWAGCITNTDWNGLREGLAPDAALFLRSTTGLRRIDDRDRLAGAVNTRSVTLSSFDPDRSCRNALFKPTH